MLQPLSAFLQKKTLFRPVLLPQNHVFRFDAPFEELFFDMADGVRINALFFRVQHHESRGVVLYFHGNRDNLQRWGTLHADFTTLGYDFLAVDYRGYGKSGGEPDEKAYFSDALHVYRWLRQRYPPDKIVLYGRSLGTGMATYLAAHEPARLLVLETPFDNIAGLLASHLRRGQPPFRPAFHFPNDQHLRRTHIPVVIFHGTRDRVVPFSSALRRKACLKPGDHFVTIDGGAHNTRRVF